jgi:hypothetical protein
LLLADDPILLTLDLVASALHLVSLAIDTVRLSFNPRTLTIYLHLLAAELALLPDLPLRHALPGNGAANAVADYRALRNDPWLPIAALLLVPKTTRTATIIDITAVAGIIITIIPPKALPDVTDRHISVSVRIAPILVVIGIAAYVAISRRPAISISVSTSANAHRGDRQQSHSKNTCTQHGNLQSVLGNGIMRLNGG